MKIITGDPGTGKTIEAIKLCIHKGYTLIVFSDGEKRRLYLSHPELMEQIQEVLTFGDVLNQLIHGRKIEAVVLDNVDMMLAGLFDVPIAAITTRSRDIIQLPEGATLWREKI